MKALFKAERQELINKVTELRAARNKLKGVKGTTVRWEQLSKEIDAVQDKIDLLSKSMGLEVKDRPRAFMESTRTKDSARRGFQLRRKNRTIKQKE